MATSELTAGALVFKRSFPPISRHMLALYCGASGDHNPIHVDLDFARASGFPDVFAHGMLVMGYMGIALEEAGHAEGLRSYSTRFLAITQLGARITCEARVGEIGDDVVNLDLVAQDENGDVKLKGRAVVDKEIWKDRLCAS